MELPSEMVPRDQSFKLTERGHGGLPVTVRMTSWGQGHAEYVIEPFECSTMSVSLAVFIVPLKLSFFVSVPVPQHVPIQRVDNVFETPLDGAKRNGWECHIQD